MIGGVRFFGQQVTMGSLLRQYHIMRELHAQATHLVITSLLITSGLTHQIICHQSSKPSVCPHDVSVLYV